MKGRAPGAAPGLLGRACLGCSPLFEVLDRVQDGRDEVRDLGDRRLHAWLVEVRDQRVLERSVVVLDHTCELEELLAAVLQGASHARFERLIEFVIYLQTAYGQ